MRIFVLCFLIAFSSSTQSQLTVEKSSIKCDPDNRVRDVVVDFKLLIFASDDLTVTDKGLKLLQAIDTLNYHDAMIPYTIKMQILTSEMDTIKIENLRFCKRTDKLKSYKHKQKPIYFRMSFYLRDSTKLYNALNKSPHISKIFLNIISHYDGKKTTQEILF
jgi:hypothetical protein